MSILNFSNRIFTLSIDNSPNSEPLGVVTNSSTARQLGNVRVLMYFHGAFSGERITLDVKDVAGAITHTSDTILVTDIDPSFSGSVDWYGWVRFDFAKEWLKASTAYNLEINSTGYTESGSLHINMVYDYPAPVNGTRLSNYSQHPIAFQVFGYERN